MNAAESIPNPNELKRSHSSDSSDDDIVAPKRYYYLLAAATTEWSSSGPESVYSYQNKSTDLAKSTSDTSTKSESELELQSEASPVEIFPPQNSSSAPEDIIPIRSNSPKLTTAGGDELGITEGEDGSDCERKVRLKSVGHYQKCIRCQTLNMHPHFPYCFFCYRFRKSSLPERPKPRKCRNRVATANSSSYDMPSSGPSSQPLSTSQELDSSCGLCLSNPKNGGFVHNTITHVYACYSCSVKAFKNSGRCPVCNTKASRVSRIVIV